VDDDGDEKKDDDDRDEDTVVASLLYRPYWDYWIDENDDYHYNNFHDPDICHRESSIHYNHDCNRINHHSPSHFDDDTTWMNVLPHEMNHKSYVPLHHEQKLMMILHGEVQVWHSEDESDGNAEGELMGNSKGK